MPNRTAQTNAVPLLIATLLDGDYGLLDCRVGGLSGRWSGEARYDLEDDDELRRFMAALLYHAAVS